MSSSIMTPLRDDPLSPRYKFLRVIGNGCFGYVFEVQDENNGGKYALKRIEKVGSCLSRQLEILEKIKNLDNVIHLHTIFYSKAENRLVQNLVFDYVDDNLENLIQKNHRQQTYISEESIKFYMFQLLNGLKSIHYVNIAHRDLKPENVLLSKDGVIQICDFGSSKFMDKNGKNTPYMVSRYYRAPELIMCVSKYTETIDIWAAACILMELYLLEPVFRGKTEGAQIFSIFEVMGGFTEEDKQYYKNEVPFHGQILDGMKAIKGKDLSEMLSMSNDRKNLIDLLRKMLNYNFRKRISAAQAMEHAYFDSVRKKQIPRRKGMSQPKHRPLDFKGK